MNKIQELINCIKNGEASKLGKLFSIGIADKATAKLDTVKKEIAKGMFLSKKKVENKQPIKEAILNDIQSVVDSNQLIKVTLTNGDSIDIDPPTANVLLTVMNALDAENKEKMIERMSQNAQEFLKVVDFAWKQVQ